MSDKTSAKRVPGPKNRWILLLYLLIVAKLVLFRVPVSRMFDKAGVSTMLEKWNTANLEPLHTIKLYLNWNHLYWSTVNILGNIAVFVPLGLLLPISFRRMNFLKTMLLSLLVILFIEFSQLYTGLGEFDVDDILLNLLGLGIGYMLYAMHPKA